MGTGSEKRAKRKKAQQVDRSVIAAALEEMPDGVMLVDEDGRVAYVNKAFEGMFGYPSAELLGMSALALPTYGGATDRERAGRAQIAHLYRFLQR